MINGWICVPASLVVGGGDVYNPGGGWGGNSVIIIFAISLNEIM